jgi:hypothetical protein
MFGLFKSKSEKEKLMDKYRKLQEEAFRLSKSDRKSADLKYAEAEELMKQIEKM